MTSPPVERFPGSALSRAEAAARQWPSPPRPMFVSAGAYAAPRLRHAAPHRYAVWKLAYYRSGSIDALVDGVGYPVAAGSVLVVPPHADHAELAHTAYSNYFVLVNARPDQPWPRLTTDDGEQRLGAAFAALVREKSDPDEHARAMVDALVRQVDILLRRDLARRHDSAARAVVNAVEQLMEERYAEHVGIDALAREVGVSGSTLRAHFAAELGTSPQSRLLDIRLRHAVSLLQTSDLTLASVAERCGYHSASHLSRHVKAALNATPGEIRRRGRLPSP
ncbi:helix-turn-helix domain-containing protein [Jiangella mangrovi]|uniref:AraC-like DNA-binding protein n=1 Tax=Jiangella mangrovi TaxID=1524084 RepID=A0A7W9LIV6_9ACTN|nr:AraC family transcriptional regulator [Jiangella mangrovi]MBB5785456.1 AraC-like DNA-binding protein [Jiangella mangrovi]